MAESKSKFLAAASHDIRQPIHAVALYTAVLESECDNPKLVPTISKIVESIGVLEGLFNALLDISKYDSGTIKPKNKTIAINKLFTQLNNEFSVQATAKNLRFELVNSNYYVYSDEILLGIVLRNLLANALKYTKTGKIGLSAELHHGKLRIVIKDTGIGIAKEYQSHIFTEFFQLQNPQRDRSKGLGLGLAIVDRLVKQLGLDLVLISEVNKGSCFIIDGLPITSKKAYSEFFNRKNDRLKGLVVVAIDDEKDILFGMEALLLKWGCSVVSGDSLESCQQILLSRNLIPDAVIADYRLGLCDGIDSIMQLRRQYNVNLPAMLVTGDTSNVVESRAKENNIAYIAKPVDIVKLNSYLINTTNASN
ncbi:MAG: hybrid sensor histidine kinase/response regulator [Gammaproteobacteria bacterium]|nr:hybrid sensor histidine kinase/response regulator [Gammaproteobacteria bacterium]